MRAGFRLHPGDATLAVPELTARAAGTALTFDAPESRTTFRLGTADVRRAERRVSRAGRARGATLHRLSYARPRARRAPRHAAGVGRGGHPEAARGARGGGTRQGAGIRRGAG